MRDAPQILMDEFRFQPEVGRELSPCANLQFYDLEGIICQSAETGMRTCMGHCF